MTSEKTYGYGCHKCNFGIYGVSLQQSVSGSQSLISSTCKSHMMAVYSYTKWVGKSAIIFKHIQKLESDFEVFWNAHNMGLVPYPKPKN